MAKDRSWSEIRPLLAQHGVLHGDGDGPISAGLIETVKTRLRGNPSCPVTAGEAGRVMNKLLDRARAAGQQPDDAP